MKQAYAVLPFLPSHALLNGLSLAHAVAGRQRSDTLQNRLHGSGGIEDCRAKVGLGLEIKRRAELRLGLSVTDAEQIALRERCSVRHVNMTISLAFLAPKLVRAAADGRLPRGINIERGAVRRPHVWFARSSSAAADTA